MDKSFLNKRKRLRSLAIALAKGKEKPVLNLFQENAR